MDLIPDFFAIVTPTLFIYASIVMFIAFAIWELPRTMKLLSPECSRGIYPETGRMIDIVLFALGFICVLLLFGFGRMDKAISAMRSPGQISIFIILLIVLPILAIVRFVKRIFSRFDAHNEIGIFTTQTILDLTHHIFFIACAIVLLGVAGSFIF